MPALSGKVALVTGAGSGIGRGIALRLAQSGAQVAAGYTGEPGDALATIGQFDDPAAGMVAPADIRVQSDVQAMVDAVVANWGRLDIMVCNAGCFLAAPLLQTTQADWRRVIDTNLTGTFFCAQAAARAMVARGTPGRIIIVASIQASRPNLGTLAYGASKAGLLALARGLALELAPHRITVVTISPGLVEAAGNVAILANPDARRAIEEKIPIGRAGQPADIGDLAAFLASDAAGYITGTDIAVDGGLLLTSPQI